MLTLDLSCRKWKQLKQLKSWKLSISPQDYPRIIQIFPPLKRFSTRNGLRTLRNPLSSNCLLTCIVEKFLRAFVNSFSASAQRSGKSKNKEGYFCNATRSCVCPEKRVMVLLVNRTSSLV